MKYKQNNIDSSKRLNDRFERQLPYTYYYKLSNRLYNTLERGLFYKPIWLVKLNEI